jgi:anaerobic selenocysteine-containing dehydrogenase
MEMEPLPCLSMHPEDAASLSVKNEDRIEISTEKGRLRVNVRVRENMAPGVLVLPKHRQISWRIFAPGRIFIPKERITAVTGDPEH